MSDNDKIRKVESTEYDKFMLSLESIANLRYNNELKLSTDGLNKEENKKYRETYKKYEKYLLKNMMNLI